MFSSNDLVSTLEICLCLAILDLNSCSSKLRLSLLSSSSPLSSLSRSTTTTKITTTQLNYHNQKTAKVKPLGEGFLVYHLPALTCDNGLCSGSIWSSENNWWKHFWHADGSKRSPKKRFAQNVKGAWRLWSPVQTVVEFKGLAALATLRLSLL